MTSSIGIALASIPTAHLIQDRILGVAVLIWLARLSAWALPISLCLCRPLSSVHSINQYSFYYSKNNSWHSRNWSSELRIGGPINPLCNNAEPFLFCGWSNNM